MAEEQPQQSPCDPTTDLVVSSLSQLGALTNTLACVLAQDVDLERVRNLGFLSATSVTDLTPAWARNAELANPAAVIVVTVGTEDMDPAMTCIKALAEPENDQSPPRIVIIITHGTELQAEMAAFAKAQRDFLRACADGVIGLWDGEPLRSHRMLESICQANIFAQKMGEELDLAQKETTEKLQSAWKRCIWGLPGAALECIPREDPTLKLRMQDGAIKGVCEYVFLEELGKGSFGSVFRARDLEKKDVAIKVIRKSNLKTVKALVSLDKEIGISRHLPPHANIVSARATLHGADCICLVMDMGGHQDLHTFLIASAGEDKILELPQCESICTQAAKAVTFVHEHKVVHRDLKPENFIVSQANGSTHIRLTDFGLAATVCGAEQQLVQYCGSVPFCAPEVMPDDKTGRGYDGFAADVWSLGICFLDCSLGRRYIFEWLGWGSGAASSWSERRKHVSRLPQILADIADANAVVRFAASRGLATEPLRRDRAWQILCGLRHKQTSPEEGGSVPAPPPGPRTVAKRPTVGATSEPVANDAEKGTADRRLGVSRFYSAPMQGKVRPSQRLERLSGELQQKGNQTLRTGTETLPANCLSDVRRPTVPKNTGLGRLARPGLRYLRPLLGGNDISVEE